MPLTGSKGFEVKVEALARDPREVTALLKQIEFYQLRMQRAASHHGACPTQNSGGYIGGVTPVPIPNTEVKPSRADGTPRETAWESRSLPDTFREGPRAASGGAGAFAFFSIPLGRW